MPFDKIDPNFLARFLESSRSAGITIIHRKPSIGYLAALLMFAIVGYCAKVHAQSYSITQIGLTGANYTYSTSGGIYEYSFPWEINQNGDALGGSARYSAAGSSLGYDAWYFNGSSTQLIGLTGPNYSYAASGGTYEQASAVGINNSGGAIGNSARYSSAADALGYDAWYFNGSSSQPIGLNGTDYSYATADGTYENSSAGEINDQNDVIGTSTRFSSTGTALGYDAWIFNGSTTVQMGLTGTSYSYPASGGTYESSNAYGENNSGDAIGISYRYDSTGDSLGYDCYYFNGSSTQLIGLTGGIYSYSGTGANTQENMPAGINDAGDAIGNANRYSSTGGSLGSDSWFFNGSSTEPIGLTGTNYSYATSGGTFQSSLPYAMNNAGDVVGTSARYNSAGTSLGVDCWFFGGSTNRQIGLVGSPYISTTTSGNTEYSAPVNMNSAGDVCGYSWRYNSLGPYLGQDAWYFNGSSTQSIGYAGAGYSYSTSGGTFEYSDGGDMNGAGDVIGFSYRYTSSGAFRGQGGWFFDSATDATTLLQFSVDNAIGYGITAPEVLTSSGAVLGYYQVYSGSTVVDNAFYWSASSGFTDLGALVNGGLSAAGWQMLQNIYGPVGSDLNGYPQFIVGEGQINGDSTGTDVYFLSAVVPEPASLSILAVAPLALLIRRRVTITTSPAN
jgi:hypothetical protein